jgi:hypothetical protein
MRVIAVRVLCVLDGIVFATSAILNFGFKIPVGFTELAFPAHVRQAGIGEAVIASALIAGGVSGRPRLCWVAFWMSVVGIAFGLISRQVQGPAREIHVVLVPLAILLGLGLLWSRQQRGSESDRLDAAE